MGRSFGNNDITGGAPSDPVAPGIIAVMALWMEITTIKPKSWDN